MRFSKISLAISFFLFLPGSVACSQVTLDSLFYDKTQTDTCSFVFEEGISPSIEKDTLRVLQWNIGHFSLGKTYKSTISDSIFKVRAQSFKDFFSLVDADFISLNEYSFYFINTASHPKCCTDTLILSEYPNKVLGNNGKNRRYSFNAIFSKYELADSRSIEYQCNQSTVITHTDKIKASDYYYIQSRIRWHDKDVIFISTHLAFDNNNNDVVNNQIGELIKVTNHDEFVIICGDFNSAEGYSIFSDHGFETANHGDKETYPSANPTQALDNIVVKGLHIHNVQVIPSFVSDHFPIICDITF